MKRWVILLVALVASTVLVFGTFSCDDDDDDDDDSGPSYGEDIEGTFSVAMEIEEDTCDEDNVGFSEPWVIEIEQTGNLAQATVYWKKEGLGTEQFELFKARVYGTVVMDADIIEEPIGNSNCVKFTARNYYIKVDLEEGALSGRLSDDIFYQGAGCDSSSQDCRQERTLTPDSAN